MNGFIDDFFELFEGELFIVSEDFKVKIVKHLFVFGFGGREVKERAEEKFMSVGFGCLNEEVQEGSHSN
jgi:hypothetical protein